ncbi:hypothetical protein [Thioclava sp. GXIMD4216]|uniref:hypothetical protein n=1 Tax=Thioclava sp. GXIMD4216 TaxID=3131929 RepID=UPI0030CB4083
MNRSPSPSPSAAHNRISELVDAAKRPPAAIYMMKNDEVEIGFQREHFAGMLRNVEVDFEVSDIFSSFTASHRARIGAQGANYNESLQLAAIYQYTRRR